MQTNGHAGPLYRLRDVKRVYRTGGGEVRAVDGVSLDIGAGELVVIEGPSGSGKTTLLQLLGALDVPSDGVISFDGRELNGLSDAERTRLRREDLGFVFQSFNLIPTLTAAENIEAALDPAASDRKKHRERSHSLLGQVGLAHRTDHLPSRLSGGEQQRVAIARALANGPRVLLADEPTGNLDSGTAREVMGLLSALSEERGMTVIVVTHAEDVARLARRRFRMRDGGLVRDGAAAVVPAGAPGTCPACGTADTAAGRREHSRCESCRKRFVRKEAEAGRPWKACPDCGGSRVTERVSLLCASCGAARSID